MKTRVVVTRRPGEVVLEECEIRPGDNEVLVKTYMSSICGTDKNYSQGMMPREVLVEQLTGNNEAHHAYPLKMGHEAAGEIVEVGRNVTDFKVGDKVMSFGWYNTMADYFTAPVVHNGFGVVKMPEGMSMEAASLGEPTACAVYACLLYTSGERGPVHDLHERGLALRCYGSKLPSKPDFGK